MEKKESRCLLSLSLLPLPVFSSRARSRRLIRQRCGSSTLTSFYSLFSLIFLPLFHTHHSYQPSNHPHLVLGAAATVKQNGAELIPLEITKTMHVIVHSQNRQCRHPITPKPPGIPPPHLLVYSNFLLRYLPTNPFQVNSHQFPIHSTAVFHVPPRFLSLFFIPFL